MSVKLNEHIFAGEQEQRAEAFSKTKLHGYTEACRLASHTVGAQVLEAVGPQPLPVLFDTMFAAGFIAGSLSAQGKGSAAKDWLIKQK